MKLRKAVSVLLGVALLLSLSACASDAAAVFVQSVAELSDIGGIAPGDRFAGIVVSENVAEVQRDSDKTMRARRSLHRRLAMSRRFGR